MKKSVGFIELGTIIAILCLSIFTFKIFATTYTVSLVLRAPDTIISANYLNNDCN